MERLTGHLRRVVEPSGMHSMRSVVLAVLLLAACVGTSAAADNPPPGPLVVKAFQQWVNNINNDPEGYVQRVTLRFENPGPSAVEFTSVDGVFLTPQDEEMFVDHPPVHALAPGEAMDAVLRYTNPTANLDLKTRVVVRYKMGGKAYEKKVVVSKDNRAVPEGWVPGQP